MMGNAGNNNGLLVLPNINETVRVIATTLASRSIEVVRREDNDNCFMCSVCGEAPVMDEGNIRHEDNCPVLMATNLLAIMAPEIMPTNSQLVDQHGTLPGLIGNDITREKPTELPGKRYRIKLSGDDIYVFISYNNGMPWEIFATAPCSWLAGDPRKGYMGAINRLAALSLQSGTEVEKVVSQLTKSSVGDGDYAGILAVLLGRGRGLNDG